MQPPAAADTRPLVAALASPGFGPGGRLFPVRAGKNLIGSGPQSEIALVGDSQVSQEHALLLHRGGQFFLSDRMSTNGTLVNGVEIDVSKPTVLADRDRVQCGETEMWFMVIDLDHEGGAAGADDASEPTSESE